MKEGEWWEIEGRGRCPGEGQEEEWIRERVREGEGLWAVAFALLKICETIRDVRRQ